MRWLLLALCLLAGSAWAQEQEPETVGNMSRDWQSLSNAMRHTASSISALVRERDRLAAQVKALEEKVQALEKK